MIVLGLVGILALAVIIGLVMARHNLPALHIVIWIGLLLMSVAFMFLSARVMRIHGFWKEKVAKVESDTETALKLQEQLQRGADSVGAVSNQLVTETVGQGQVWHNVIVAPGPNGIIADLRFWSLDRCVGSAEEGGPLAPIPADAPPAESTADAGGESTDVEAADAVTDEGVVADGAAPVAAPSFKPHGLQVDMHVYAFREIRVDRLPPPVQQFLFRLREGEGGSEAPTFFTEEGRSAACRLPLVYVGRFRVADVQGPNATLIPSEPVTQAMVEKINQREPQEPTTWAIYEELPADSRIAFQGATQNDLTALAGVALAGRDPAGVSSWINELLADGKPVPPDQAREVRVRFLKPHTIEVDAAATEPLPAEPFDSSGRATASSLAQGRPTEFAEGDEIILDRQTAADLQAKGIVQPVESLSSRWLRDYAQLFSSISDRQSEVTDRLTVAQEDLKAIQQANSTLESEQTALQTELDRLASDKSGLSSEIALLDRYLKTLQGRSQQLRGQLTERYQQNIQMRQQIAAQQGVAIN